MRRAIALADELSGQAIIEMHRTLLTESAPEIVGHWSAHAVEGCGRRSSASRRQAVVDNSVLMGMFVGPIERRSYRGL